MKLFECILDLLYPPRCMLCRKFLPDKRRDICLRCSKKLPALMSDSPRRDIKNIRLCIAPFSYRGELRKSLHRYKFNGLTAYGRIYAEFIAKSIDENHISCDIISWVPLSKKGLRKRGYDQAELIAKELAKIKGLPCERLLVKIKDTPRQSSIKGRQARADNVSGAYRCASAEELLGKRVLLIDDIVTTGATLRECASILRGAGCNEIYAAAAASKDI